MFRSQVSGSEAATRISRQRGLGVGAHVADERVERGDVAHRAGEGVHCPVVLRHLICGSGFGNQGLEFRVQGSAFGLRV